jgi:hypothetical protein
MEFWGGIMTLQFYDFMILCCYVVMILNNYALFSIVAAVFNSSPQALVRPRLSPLPVRPLCPRTRTHTRTRTRARGNGWPSQSGGRWEPISNRVPPSVRYIRKGGIIAPTLEYMYGR